MRKAGKPEARPQDDGAGETSRVQQAHHLRSLLPWLHSVLHPCDPLSHLIKRRNHYSHNKVDKPATSVHQIHFPTNHHQRSGGGGVENTSDGFTEH